MLGWRPDCDEWSCRRLNEHITISIPHYAENINMASSSDSTTQAVERSRGGPNKMVGLTTLRRSPLDRSQCYTGQGRQTSLLQESMDQEQSEPRVQWYKCNGWFNNLVLRCIADGDIQRPRTANQASDPKQRSSEIAQWLRERNLHWRDGCDGPANGRRGERRRARRD
jgi:hypothetical protein